MSMTKEQKEVIKRLEKLVELRKNKAEQIKYDNCICETEDLETVLNMLKEKDKMIDLMAEYLDEDDTSLANYLYRKNGKCNREMVKQYFERRSKECQIGVKEI